MKPEKPRIFAEQGMNRQIVLIGTIVALLALFVLAAGLSDLRLRPAERFAIQQAGDNALAEPAVMDVQADWVLWGIVIVTGLLLLLTLVTLLREKIGKRELARYALQILMFSVVLYLAYTGFQGDAVAQEEGGLPPDLPIPARADTERIEVAFVEPDVAPGFAFAVSTGIALLAAAAGYFYWRSRSQPIPARELAHIARSALHDLESDGNWKDAVIKTYVQMTRAVRNYRGLRRPEASTPGEFAVLMQSIGLPSQPVQSLTDLFERVRYGGMPSSDSDAAAAAECLRSIIEACERL